MNPMRTSVLALCVAFLALPGILPVSAQNAPTMEDSDSPCRAALEDAQDQLAERKAAGPLDAYDASLLVDEVAGATCGFSILEGRLPVDPRAAADILAVSQTVTPQPGRGQGPGINYAAAGKVISFVGGVELPNAPAIDGKVVPCKLGGSGAGTITARILGITLDDQTAAGQWTGQDQVVHVAGTAAIVSGSQAGSLGDMFVAAVGPLPSISGGSGATCLQTETQTVVEESCWWLVFWWKCTQKVQVDVNLEPCGATASQHSIADLLSYEHSYAVASNPCDGASSSMDSEMAADRVPVSETVQEVTVYRPV